METAPQKTGEPSLAPACGFFLLLAAVMLSVAMALLSWWLGDKQSVLASQALQKQLIPWVEESYLSDADKQSIIERLRELIADIDAERLTESQLRKLSFRLNSNPIFQWGCVEELQRQANTDVDLTDTEKQGIDQAIDRLLRSVLEGKMAMEELSFIVQKVATTERISQRLIPKPMNASNDLREFWRRMEAVCNKLQISKEPVEKSPSQVFRQIIEEALIEK